MNRLKTGVALNNPNFKGALVKRPDAGVGAGGGEGGKKAPHVTAKEFFDDNQPHRAKIIEYLREILKMAGTISVLPLRGQSTAIFFFTGKNNQLVL